jgi:hypothetical protein
MRLAAGVVVCVGALALGGQTRSSSPSLTAQISAAETRVTNARPHTMADAEAEGAAYPRVPSTLLTDRAPRSCTVVAPTHIVLPTTSGDPHEFRLASGDFVSGSISFGWGDNYEQAKMPLTPLHPDVIGAGLWIRVIRLDQPGPDSTLALDKLTGGRGNPSFFPAWPKFPTPGRWMLLATAGANWGCFVLDRPVKSFS